MMSGKSLKYLCALLNSKLLRWYLQQVAPTSGMGTLRWKKVYIETIPIPKITEAEQQPFISLVDEAISNKKMADHTSTPEAKIDGLVCKLYNLTKDEISLSINQPP